MSEYPLTPKEDEGDQPDIFTRLSIAMCQQDDGTRPVNPAWVGSDISYLSPAINFAAFPVPANVPTEVSIQINNFGTQDASAVFLETAYNIYIGNQSATMNNIQNLTIPLIPAGYPYIAKVTWTPPDIFVAHACFHARVFDSYSKLYYPARCMSWDPYINPQAAAHNTIILKVSDPNKSAVVTYPAANTTSNVIHPKILITEINNRARFNDLDERFPLPFVPDHLTSTSVLREEVASRDYAYEVGLDHAVGYPVPAFPRAELRTAGASPRSMMNLRWPRASIQERFIHNRFGFDLSDRMDIPEQQQGIHRSSFFTEQALAENEICSLMNIRMEPEERKLIRLVIPPSQFPAPGRRKKFQIDYQVGDEHPVQNFLYIYR